MDEWVRFVVGGGAIRTKEFVSDRGKVDEGRYSDPRFKNAKVAMSALA